MAGLELSRTTDTIVKTLVEYDFDGTKVEVMISHFNPQSEDDIALGIANREISERRLFDEARGQ